jgi:acetyltransferase-like isoleucine patch superfamily enzyme
MYLPGKFKKFLSRSSDPGKFMTLGPGTSSSSIRLELRKPLAGTEYLFAGENCVLDGRFVFERDQGEIRIGNNTFIGGSTLICARKIEIGDDVLISWGCTIIDNDAHATSWEHRKNDVADWRRGIMDGNPGQHKDWSHVAMAPIRIGDKAWIGFNSIILKGVTIGEGAVVGAGSVVTTDVPPYSVVAGNPARIVKELSR